MPYTSIQKNACTPAGEVAQTGTHRRFEIAEIVANEHTGEGVYRLTLKVPHIASGCVLPSAGQFYMISLNAGEHILPRPLSVHAFDEVSGTLSFLYKTAGKGTRLLSRCKAAESVQLHGPLGRGFDIPESSGVHVLIGGGIGLAPLGLLAKHILASCSGASVVFIAGGRDRGIRNVIERLALDSSVRLLVCTDDGSEGMRGNAADMLASYLNERKIQSADSPVAMLYACGPNILLSKINALAAAHDIPCQVSLEHRMACGVKACMGCSVQTLSGIKKVCADGPVFDAYLLRTGEKSL